MKASYNWLKDYVDISIDPKKLAAILTMAGVTVDSWEKTGRDYTFNFEITSNRADLLSMIGIAREAAALLGKKLKIPKELKGDSALFCQDKKGRCPLSVKIEDPGLCGRYTARAIKGVEVGPSPEWLKTRIISAGLRPVNNIVDITNFVLLETGQPLHAFDMDRIKGGLFVRRARKGERIITIDNTPRICNENMPVIADESGPIAIAGIMGGLATEVTGITRNILLESASFNASSIRRASRALGVSSESSYRFERKVNERMIAKASDRASALITEITGGKAGPLTDVGARSGKHSAKTISFNPEKTNLLLGISLGRKKAFSILKALGFTLHDKKGTVKVTVPGFRGDVKSEVDLAEEIARVYGYDKIPATIPRIVGNTMIKDAAGIFEERMKKILIRLGLNEIITYSLISKRSAKGLNIPEDEIIAIKNPLSIDQEILRPSLLPGMLGAISHNLKRYAKNLSFFEIGKTYREKNASYKEEPVLSVGLTGVKTAGWTGAKKDFDFFDIKGIFEKLFEEFGLTDKILFKKRKTTGLSGNTASVAEYDGEIIASLGEADKKVREKFDVEKTVFYGEIYMETLRKKAHLKKRYTPYSRYPSVTRDISIIAERHTTSHEITRTIKETGKALVNEISLIGLYKGKEVPEGKKALLYRIEYRSNERTLEDAEVTKLHSAVKSALSEKLNISFR